MWISVMWVFFHITKFCIFSNLGYGNFLSSNKNILLWIFRISPKELIGSNIHFRKCFPIIKYYYDVNLKKNIVTPSVESLLLRKSILTYNFLT